ncbi:MAG TPA: GNAT family N-acetyltransferase [Anaerolineales bacterium]|nr:GNAT family N-acetyltransferase [Anaerolineales bacterium]
MFIEKVSRVTDDLCHALEHLIPQLGVHKRPPSREELEALIHSGSSHLLVARYPDEHGEIAGTLCLTVYRVPSGVRSIVEDLVVDEKMRRLGIGEALIRYAIDLAREAGANGVSLTSNQRRVAANLFYQALGFEKRETNVYFYRLE